MGRYPCCKLDNVDDLKKGPWTSEEDEKLVEYIQENGHGNWQLVPKKAGLKRCGKSCRLRWTNYLRPDIKRGAFSIEEEETIINLHSLLGNKWSRIAIHLPGRTDNEIKNFWNTHLKKKLLKSGIDPVTHQPITNPNLLLISLSNLMNPFESALRLQAELTEIAKNNIIQNIIQVLNPPLINPSLQENNYPMQQLYNNLSPYDDQIFINQPSTISNYISDNNMVRNSSNLENNMINNGLISKVCNNSEYSSLINPVTPQINSVPFDKQLDITPTSYDDFDVLMGKCLEDEANKSLWQDIISS